MKFGLELAGKEGLSVLLRIGCLICLYTRKIPSESLEVGLNGLNWSRRNSHNELK